MPAPRIPRGMARLLDGRVDDVFDRLLVRLLGHAFTAKHLLIDFDHELTLPGIFAAAVREEGGSYADRDLLIGIAEVAKDYLDKHRAEAKAATKRRIQSLLYDVEEGRIQPQHFRNHVERELSELWARVRNNVERVVDTEAQHAQSIGVKEGLDQINANLGIEDPTICFIPVKDDKLCDECRRLHMLPDGTTPKVWKSSEVSTEYHERGEQRPSWHLLHPHCRCALTTVLPGFGFKNGRIAFIALGHDEWKHQRQMEKSESEIGATLRKMARDDLFGQNPVAKRLIAQHGGKVLPFPKLPKTAQAAIRQYMSAAPEKAQQLLPKRRFGYVEVPTDDLKAGVMAASKELRGQFNTFNDYHKWYVSQGDTPNHGRSVWPSFFSTFPDELFEDGWHRFHSYVRNGLPKVPVVYFVKSEEDETGKPTFKSEAHDPIHDWASQLAAYLASDHAYSILGNDGTWNAGGCRLLADALKQHFGAAATTHAVASDTNPVEHIVTKVGPWFIDGDGPQTAESLTTKMRDVEGVPNPRLTPFEPTTYTGEIGSSPEKVKALAQAIGEHVGAPVAKSEEPLEKMASRPAARLTLPQAHRKYKLFRIVHDGRIPGMNGDRMTVTPSLPTIGGVEGEDRTTKRVSVAPTIHQAASGVLGWSNPEGWDLGEWSNLEGRRVYGLRTLPKGHVPNAKLHGLVPDAKDTGEEWLTEPAEMEYIGHIFAHKPEDYLEHGEPIYLERRDPNTFNPPEKWQQVYGTTGKSESQAGEPLEKALRWRELEPMLNRHGWQFQREGGDHRIFVHPTIPRTLAIKYEHMKGEVPNYWVGKYAKDAGLKPTPDGKSLVPHPGHEYAPHYQAMGLLAAPKVQTWTPEGPHEHMDIASIESTVAPETLLPHKIAALRMQAQKGKTWPAMRAMRYGGKVMPFDDKDEHLLAAAKVQGMNRVPVNVVESD